MLDLIEGAAGALDFSTALATYIKVAGVVLDGVEGLLGLGDSDPIIGMRKEFDPEAGDELEPGYFALIDLPDQQIPLDQLWVRDNRLMIGPSLEKASPFQQAEFVLFSIAHATDRTDVTTLPFYPLFEQVKEAAARPDEESWKRAKANMLTLYQTLVLSPDLTTRQADELNDRYVEEMLKIHKRAVQLGSLSVEEAEGNASYAIGAEAGERATSDALEMESKMRKAVNILDLEVDQE